MHTHLRIVLSKNKTALASKHDPPCYESHYHITCIGPGLYCINWALAVNLMESLFFLHKVEFLNPLKVSAIYRVTKIVQAAHMISLTYVIGLGSRQLILRKVSVHFVPIKVSVVSLAVSIV